MARKNEKARLEKYRQEMSKAHNKRLQESYDTINALKERCKSLEEDNRNLYRKTQADSDTIKEQAKLIEKLQAGLKLSDDQLDAMRTALDVAHGLKGVAALSQAMLDALMEQPGHEYLLSQPTTTIKIGDTEP